MDLQTYLDRIEYTGSLEPNLETLRAVHRAHLLRIPYENLDIHLGRTLTLNVRDAYERIVLEHRGGWCFEMNGLLAWALQEIGFEVRLLSGSVERTNLNGPAYGDHLVLLVPLEGQRFVADVGFGDGFLEPLPLVEAESNQRGFAYRLERVASGPREHWVAHNHPRGGAKRFDFDLEPHDIQDFASRCHWLQTAPESGFVKTTVCQKSTLDGFITLRGATLITLTPHGESKRVLETQREFETALRDEFGLEIPGVDALWAKVWARHLEWIASNHAS
jgi:N-hydroxyarylamine O-acetyltransferase